MWHVGKTSLIIALIEFYIVVLSGTWFLNEAVCAPSDATSIPSIDASIPKDSKTVLTEVLMEDFWTKITSEDVDTPAESNGNEMTISSTTKKPISSTTTTLKSTTVWTTAKMHTTPSITTTVTPTSKTTTTINPSVATVASELIGDDDVERRLGGRPPVYPPAANEEDKRIRQIWGGNCTVERWDLCKSLRYWGGDYLVPNKMDPEMKLVLHDGIRDCYNTTRRKEGDSPLCLRNGWTVTQCQLWCMGFCNPELKFKFEKYVSHIGNCKYW